MEANASVFFCSVALQRLHGRKHLVPERARRGDVHPGGKNVVRRLPEVHVVVGVHQALLPALAAEQLGSAVGEHLVDVHVGLGARAGLPHHQRKFRVVAAGQHLVGRARDGLRLLFRKQAEVGIDAGRRFLDERQRVDQRERHALARDAEEAAAALRLRAPQALGGHLDGAEAVLLDPGAAHRGPNVTSAPGPGPRPPSSLASAPALASPHAPSPCPAS